MFPRFSPNYSFREIFQSIIPSRNNAVSLLENKMADLSSHAEAIAFRYGRSGIYYLLKALGAKGKKVIIPSYTCVVVSHAIIKSGNIPVFLDNDPDKFQPDPKQYLKAIDDQTVMVIFTNLFGIAENVEKIYDAIKLHHPNVFILQDCAHSFFCKDSAGNVVTKFGDAAIFGMNISKLSNSVKGGMLTIDNIELAKKIRTLAALKNQSIISLVSSRIYTALATFAFSHFLYKITYIMQYKTTFLARFTQYYSDNTIELPPDHDQRMSNFEAEIGLLSLKKYNKRVKIRQEIAQIYLDKLNQVSNKLIMKLPDSNPGNSWSHFPVNVKPELKTKIIAALSRNYEIGEIVDYSITDLSAYRKLGSKCVNSSKDAESVINLPLTYKEGLMSFCDHKKKANIFIDEFIALIQNL